MGRFPFQTDSFRMNTEYNRQLFKYLCEFITPNKRNRLEEVVDNRTRHLCVVLEDIFQSHNASAVIRSAECLGVQDVHIIENEFKYEIIPDVVVGSTKWTTQIHYNRQANNTAECINYLKQQGYIVYGTSPHADALSLPDIPLETKTAILFGTEKVGLSDLALGMCDKLVTIPMYGFTESYNISVSAALCIWDFMKRLRQSEVNWKLSEAERYELLASWVKRSLTRPDLLEDEFIKRFYNSQDV